MEITDLIDFIDKFNKIYHWSDSMAISFIGVEYDEQFGARLRLWLVPKNYSTLQ